MATSLSILAHEVSNKSCHVMKTLPVPVYSSPRNVAGFTSKLTDDISLSWDVPDCKDCEVKGGVCQLSMNGNQQIGCLYGPRGTVDATDEENRKNLMIFRIIAFCIAIPAILSAVGVGIFLCVMDRREGDGPWANRRGNQIAATPNPQDAVMGLDQATIDSYTKVVLGQSRRVPGVNDGSCPICLSDFKPTETLRCIPECQHCFHADCIDEWLRMNGTCPLCRSSPAHPLQNVIESST
ncbi:hypothetical protein RND81_02G130500 [Saponaria officinalis]|uniref:RING-type E3 ubiquitin transferase n=1 Tax=Saponaria officinalis TaxID=3572 RepID=A0AAW1MSL7_SAPOF